MKRKGSGASSWFCFKSDAAVSEDHFYFSKPRAGVFGVFLDSAVLRGTEMQLQMWAEGALNESEGSPGVTRPAGPSQPRAFRGGAGL